MFYLFQNQCKKGIDRVIFGSVADLTDGDNEYNTIEPELYRIKRLSCIRPSSCIRRSVAKVPNMFPLN